MLSSFGFLPNRTATPTVTAAAVVAPVATVVGAAIVTAAAAQFTPPVKRNRDENRMSDCRPSVVSVCAVSIAMREICPRCLYVATVVGVEVSLPFELLIHM